MGSDIGGLRSVLDDLKAATEASACAIVARSGVPIAHLLPEDSHLDNFGTMAATMVGALDVLYSGLHRDPPSRVVVDAGGSSFVAQAITEGALLVAILPSWSPKAAEAFDTAVFRAKGFLGSDEF
jgi:predicted regulator of Ras-like GTPase activity (Roadblock/LC7/MglB family)